MVWLTPLQGKWKAIERGPKCRRIPINCFVFCMVPLCLQSTSTRDFVGLEVIFHLASLRVFLAQSRVAVPNYVGIWDGTSYQTRENNCQVTYALRWFGSDPTATLLSKWSRTFARPLNQNTEAPIRSTGPACRRILHLSYRTCISDIGRYPLIS